MAKMIISDLKYIEMGCSALCSTLVENRHHIPTNIRQDPDKNNMMSREYSLIR
jgi:hypothetical protein